MKKELYNCTEEDLSDFEKLVKPLIEYIRSNWNVKDLKPKNYDSFTEDYTDYDGMDELNIEFDGVLDDTPCGHSFPVSCSLPHVAYNEICQGRDPLTTLIYSAVSFGMSVQAQREKIKESDFLDTMKIFKSGKFNYMFSERFLKSLENK